MKTQITGLLNSVSDPKTGLMAGLNCKFLRDNLRNIYNAFCIALVVPLSTLILLIGISSICMFFLSYFAYSAAMRLSKKPANNKAAKTLEN